MRKVLKCVQLKYLQQFPNSLLKVTSSLKPFSIMEGLDGIRGAEGGMESEFHDIPSQGPSQTSQASYIRAPAQGLPSTNEYGGAPDAQVNYTNQPMLPALTILFKMLREDGRLLPVGCFTERGVARRVYVLTGVAVDRVTMVTLTDALVEFAPGTLVVTIAQALDQITKWEDHHVWVSVLMGNRQYIMKLCQERAEHEEQRKAMEAEVERMHENQLEQQDKLSELIDKVNDQAKMVGEMQQSQITLQSGSAPRIPQLQGQVPVHSSVASSGSVPRIPSSIHTPTGVYGTPNVNPSFQGQKHQEPRSTCLFRRNANSKGGGRICDRLFHGMSDKLRDSVRFLYSQPGCTFTKLLRVAMMCENEAALRALIKAKSLQVSVDEDEQVASSGINSIKEQLDQMRTILKGVNFKPNNGFKSQKNDKQNFRNKLKGPGTSSAGPFKKGKKPVQCHRCNGWGHYKQQCPSEEPIKGSKEWANLNGEETKKGGPLPQDQPTNPQQ